MKSYSKLFLKIGFLILLFLVVTQSIGYFKSDKFVKLAEGIFGGSNQKLNWCPSQSVLEKIEIQFQGQKFEFKSDTHLYLKMCPLAIDPFDARNLGNSKFVPLVQVFGSEGSIETIEGDLETGIFRHKGLPFASTQLDWLIKNYR